MKKNVLVEVYCGSVADAVEAEAGGADRIELNNALFLGGLTPSLGTLKEVKKRIDIPVMTMIRPRAGGFCYSESEVEVMKRDTELALENGAEGIVFGILKEDGTLDQEKCREIIELTDDQELVFHRAFDVVADPLQTVDQLIELGFDRILTKGQSNRIEAGIELVKKVMERAGDQLEVVVGGIKPFNYQYVLEKLECRQVHISSFNTYEDKSTTQVSDVYFGSTIHPPENQYQVVNREGISELGRKIKKISGK